MPLAAAPTDATTLNVALPPLARSTAWLMLPLPLAAHDEPALATHVHVAPDSWAGSVSATVAPVTDDGPVLVATIV